MKESRTSESRMKESRTSESRMKEGRNLEFKEKLTNTFLKTVSAYANFGDGDILFGVDDTGNVMGIKDIRQLRLDIENKINDTFDPRPVFTMTEEDGILRLSVKEGKDKPYLYKGKAYRRSDTATIEVDRSELRELCMEGSNTTFEELACHSEELTFRALESKMHAIIGITSISDDVLRTLGLRTRDGRYNNAAAILADENQLPGIDMARFGRSISEFLDRETVAGVSALTQYDRAVEMFRRYYQYEVIDGFVRRKVEVIPEEAFREAVANALVHRRWDHSSHIRISMFDTHVEINSPGGLPKDITPSDYLSGSVSKLRNKITGTVFSRLDYMELFGTGVRRIMDAYEGATRKPQFRITDTIISVTLPILKDTYDVTCDEQLIIDALRDGSYLASSELSQRTGFNKAKTIRTVNKLKEAGFVYATGQGRATTYHIVD